MGIAFGESRPTTRSLWNFVGAKNQLTILQPEKRSFDVEDG